MQNETETSRRILSYAPWAIRRLRVMLQIAMTYELGGDLERAQVHYHNGWDFAKAIIRSLSEPSEREPYDDSMTMLEHMNILFQSPFAEAWVAEKLEGAVDTSCSIVEGAVIWIRARLPNVEPVLRTADPQGPLLYANTVLVVAELHDKAGDLFFFKGRQGLSDADTRWSDFTRGPEEKLADASPASDSHVTGSGYLGRAEYHYLVSLHELRRFIVDRRENSENRSNALNRQKNGPAIRKGSWPSFVYQGIHSSVADFAETRLARISLVGLWQTLDEDTNTFESIKALINTLPTSVEKTVRFLDDWFESRDDEKLVECDNDDPKLWGALQRTLGKWQGTNGDPKAKPGTAEATGLVVQDHALDPSSCLLQCAEGESLYIVLHLQMASARYAARAGFLDNGAQELLIVAQTCARYLRWFRIINCLVSGSIRGPDILEPLNAERYQFAFLLAEIGQRALSDYDKYSSRSRRRTYNGSFYLIGSRVGVNAAAVLLELHSHCVALSQLCKATYSSEHEVCRNIHSLDGKFDALFRKWAGENVTEHADRYDRHALTGEARSAARSRMIYLIGRHQFPALDRLTLIKLLVDDEALTLLNNAKFPTTVSSKSACIHRSRYLELVTVFRTLIKEEETLNAALHFTPAMSAETASLMHLLVSQFDSERSEEIARTRVAARDRLVLAQQSISMGRQYYRAISGLYYLYDDFNDRRLHINHAMGIAGSDLYERLKFTIGED